MQMTRAFVDTNILVYAHDGASPNKQKTARALLAAALQHNGLVLSSQVLTEFCHVAQKRLAMPTPEVIERVELYSSAEVFLVTPLCLQEALALQAAFQISFWDSAILAAAKLSDCSVLYSEGFQHGRKYQTVEVTNPFI